jgi:hypothetical protein
MLEQLRNAFLPILVTVSGMFNVPIRSQHPSNAPSQMPVASIGMLSVVGQTLGPGEKHVSENESLWRVTATGGLHSIKGAAHIWWNRLQNK